jgi:hypothetical protein
MKFVKPHLLKLLCFLLLVSVLSACKQEQPAGTYKNEAIEAGQREELHKLNDQLFNLLKANKIEELKSMMSKELLEGDPINRTVELISLQSKAGTYDILDEYYLKDKAEEPGSLLINADAKGDDAYTLKYNQSITQENYVAFLIPKNGADKWMITAIYGKYNYGWKLNKLDFGQYAVNGKNAPELYKQAKEKYGKGYLIDAVNDMAGAEKCFRPSTQWQYAKEAEMNQYFFKAVQLVNEKYTFPYPLKQVSTQPKIFRILTEKRPEGTFPMIYYLTSVSIKDTVALKKENEQIKKVIGKVLPGIDKDKKIVLYTAFSGLPGPKKTVQQFQITDKL